MQGMSQWLQGHTIPITLAATFLLLPVGVWLLNVDNQGTWKRDLGVALVTGSLFFAASLFVQISFESSNFRMTIAVTNDLTGFDANGRALQGVTLAGKTLYRANLKGARLVGRTFPRRTSPRPSCKVPSWQAPTSPTPFSSGRT